MKKSFAVFELSDTLEEIPIKVHFKKILPDHYVEKTYYKKLLIQVPLVIHPFSVLGIEGHKVKLPLTSSIIKEKDENYIKTVLIKSINKMVDEEETNMFVFPLELDRYLSDVEVLTADGKQLAFLTLNQIVEQCIKRSPKDPKDIHYVIIDGEDNLAKFCSDFLYEKINYLTILTKRPSYFEDYIDEIYNDTGLAIELIQEPLLEDLNSDIIINCSKEKNKAFYFFNKKAFYIDFLSKREEVRNILLKRKDLQVVDNVSYTVDNQEVDAKILEAAIFSQHRILRSWLFYGYKDDMLTSILRNISHYPIELHHLYQYGRRMY